MSDEISIGDRVIHPKMWAWGVGEVTAINPPNITVFFETVGERELRIEIVNLQKVDGSDAESSLLDSKFKTKRRGRKRRFEGPKFFNGGKYASGKQFVERLGGTCANWN